jgi:hypothetical protein
MRVAGEAAAYHGVSGTAAIEQHDISRMGLVAGVASSYWMVVLAYTVSVGHASHEGVSQCVAVSRTNAPLVAQQRRPPTYVLMVHAGLPISCGGQMNSCVVSLSIIWRLLSRVRCGVHGHWRSGDGSEAVATGAGAPGMRVEMRWRKGYHAVGWDTTRRNGVRYANDVPRYSKEAPNVCSDSPAGPLSCTYMWWT